MMKVKYLKRKADTEGQIEVGEEENRDAKSERKLNMKSMVVG